MIIHEPMNPRDPLAVLMDEEDALLCAQMGIEMPSHDYTHANLYHVGPNQSIRPGIWGSWREVGETVLIIAIMCGLIMGMYALGSWIHGVK